MSYFCDVKRKPNSYFLYKIFTLMILIEGYFLKWVERVLVEVPVLLKLLHKNYLKKCLEMMLKRMLIVFILRFFNDLAWGPISISKWFITTFRETVYYWVLDWVCDWDYRNRRFYLLDINSLSYRDKRCNLVWKWLVSQDEKKNRLGKYVNWTWLKSKFCLT